MPEQSLHAVIDKATLIRYVLIYRDRDHELNQISSPSATTSKVAPPPGISRN